MLHDILALDPDDPYALYLLGECALGGGRPAEAVGLLTRALALRPTHRDTRLNLARSLLANQNPAGALDALGPLAADTRLAPAQSLRGTALNALGRPEQAIEAFTHALAVSPGDAETQLNCGTRPRRAGPNRTGRRAHQTCHRLRSRHGRGACQSGAPAGHDGPPPRSGRRECPGDRAPARIRHRALEPGDCLAAERRHGGWVAKIRMAQAALPGEFHLSKRPAMGR